MEKPSHIALTSYFKGHSNGDDTREVEQWKQQHEEEFLELEKIWNVHGSLASAYSPDLEAAWSKIDERTSDKFQLKWVYSIAASVLIVLGAVWMLQETKVDATGASYYASTEKMEFDLTDGSHITLSAGSRLDLAEGFGESGRIMELSGKGYFEVASNDDLPFIIKSQRLEVQVVGTVFEVDAAGESPSVKVVEGVILVESQGDEIELSAGEAAQFNEANELMKVSMDQNALAWKTYTLVFTNATLGKLASDVSDFYDITLEVSETSAERKITSTFSDQSFQDVLTVVRSSLGVEVDSLGPTHYQIK